MSTRTKIILGISIVVVSFGVLAWMGHALESFGIITVGGLIGWWRGGKRAATQPIPTKDEIDHDTEQRATELKRTVEARVEAHEVRKQEPVTDRSIAESRARLANLRKRR